MLVPAENEKPDKIIWKKGFLDVLNFVNDVRKVSWLAFHRCLLFLLREWSYYTVMP